MTVTNDRTSDLPQRSGSFQAMVRAGDSVTAYLRTGKGEPVVLLRRAGHADALWGLLLAEVSSAFRAILPEQAPPGDSFASWFRSFLDGLGLGTVRVVADAHFGVRCAESGLLDPDWLTILVVVTDDVEHSAVRRAFEETIATNGPSNVPTTIIVNDGASWHAVAADTVARLRSRTG
jgi:hypothetical protein